MPEPTSMLNKTSGFAVFFFANRNFISAKRTCPWTRADRGVRLHKRREILYTRLSLGGGGGEWKKFDLDAKSCKLLLLLINLPPSHAGDAAAT
jgi:hypothetical protein